MTNKVQRSVRLAGFDSTFLNRTTGSNGEVFYDQTNKTLRIMDGRTRGGNPLAAGAIVSDTPPLQPQQGQFWIKASTGVIYMWYVDVLGGQWIQPETKPVGSLVSEFEFAAATETDLGLVKVDGTTINIDENGVISSTPALNFIDPVFLGISTAYIPASTLNTITGASGVVEHNVETLGTTFYHTGVVSNFTANFTGIPETNNRSTTLTLVIDQGSTARIASGVQINGSSVPVSWVGGIEPTGSANNIDIINFVVLRMFDMWTVVGSLSSQGEV